MSHRQDADNRALSRCAKIDRLEPYFIKMSTTKPPVPPFFSLHGFPEQTRGNILAEVIRLPLQAHNVPSPVAKNH